MRASSWYSVRKWWFRTGEGSVTTGQSRAAGGQSIVAFMRSVAPSFSLYFLGLLAVRVWLQSAIYDRYLSTDAGFITVVSNVVRVVLIVAMLAIAVWRGFPERRLSALSVTSIASMTAASVLFLLELESGIEWLLWPACLLAGFGIIWGGGMWMRFYERLAAGEALLCLFLSLAGSCIVGFFLGLIPENVVHLVGILMPVTSLFAYQHAMSALDERELARGGAAGDAGREGERCCGDARCYDAEPRSTFVRLVAGVALFNLALGLARGFPHGDAIPLPVAYQAVHQFGTCLLCLLVIWWALVKGRGVRFSTLWIVSISFIIIGVLLLSFSDENLMASGATFISIANTFTLGVLWYCAYDLGRFMGVPAYAVLGVAWVAHLLPREVGRSIIWLVGPSDVLTTVTMVAMVVLIAVSIGFVMNDSIPRCRPFFAELNGARRGAPGGAAGAAADAPAASIAEQPVPEALAASPALPPEAGQGTAPAGAAEAAIAEPAAAEPSAPESPDDRAFRRLRELHFLTEREVEVARLMAQGRSKAVIASRLYLSENTVRTHARNLYAKLDVHSRQELLDAIEAARDEG